MTLLRRGSTFKRLIQKKKMQVSTLKSLRTTETR
nr:MAG TPA: hypothetical protein [Caudoviricetes sp.]